MKQWRNSNVPPLKDPYKARWTVWRSFMCASLILSPNIIFPSFQMDKLRLGEVEPDRGEHGGGGEWNARLGIIPRPWTSDLISYQIACKWTHVASSSKVTMWSVVFNSECSITTFHRFKSFQIWKGPGPPQIWLPWSIGKKTEVRRVPLPGSHSEALARLEAEPWISSLGHPALSICSENIPLYFPQREGSPGHGYWGGEEKFPFLLPKSGSFHQPASCWPRTVTLSWKTNLLSAPLAE